MKEAVALYQYVLGVSCIAALCAMLLVCLLYRLRIQFDTVLRWVRLHPVQSCVLAPMVVCAVLYGGSKPDPVTPTVKGITLGSPIEIPTQVSLAWHPDEGTAIGTNQRVRVYWRDAANTNWQVAAEGYGITNAVISGFFINRDTDWMVEVDGATNDVQEVQR